MANNNVENGSTFSIDPDADVDLKCIFPAYEENDNPQICEITTTSPPKILDFHRSESEFSIVYSVPSNERTGNHVYRCSTTDYFVTITLVYSNSPPTCKWLSLS